MVKAVFDELQRKAPRRHFTDRHRRRRDAHVARTGIATFRTEADDVSTRCLLRPRRRRHRRRQQELDQDHRPGDRPLRRRATSSTTRRSRAPSPSRTCASSPRPIRLGLPRRPRRLRRLPSVRVRGQDRCARARRAGCRLPAERAVSARRSVWDHLPREMQDQMIEKQIRFFAIDAYALAKQAGMGGRINTIMQTCFFAISGVLPRGGGDRAHQEGDREDLRQAGAGGGAPELRSGGSGARPPARDPGARDGECHAHASAARLGERRPTSSRRSPR